MNRDIINNEINKANNEKESFNNELKTLQYTFAKEMKEGLGQNIKETLIKRENPSKFKKIITKIALFFRQ